MQNYCPIKLFVARTKQKIFPYLLFSAQIEHNLLLNNFFGAAKQKLLFFLPKLRKNHCPNNFFQAQVKQN